MKLVMMFLPLIWLSQNVQEELMLENGQFDYYRFWNPDVRQKFGEFHIWCWGDAAIKFTDEDAVILINGGIPSYTPMTVADEQACKLATTN
jgi:hypothetical protein